MPELPPHSPRSVPTNFDVKSEPELIEGNVLRVEPLSSDSHRNISVPIQKLVQRSKRRGMGNMPKPLAGGHELLLTHQELSVSGEDHIALRTVDPIVLQRQGQKDKELVEEPTYFLYTRRRNWKQPQLWKKVQWCLPASEESKERPKGPQKKEKGPKNHQGKGKGKEIWHLPYPQGYRIPKLDPSAMDSFFNMARTLLEFTAKEQERRNNTFP
ncbi:hypothetical protein O181_063107 [Austropuccinia psidii MF-1]|uniref:Uncharacterized protein n=1 Tax=Austropuccinia psidii MF-1 TaxID=1389203 RepID=A0A9Q3I105_9BASI|nr:hypothetical protein [Austropuccinia psidii MF-1]